MALSLLTLASNPYLRAFDAQRGGHLILFLDSQRTRPQTIAAAARSVGATTNGPWLTTEMLVSEGQQKWTIQVAGRDDPGGPVEQLRIVAGRWHENPGEIVLTKSFANLHKIQVGDTLTVSGRAGGPTYPFKVTGLALDVDQGDANFTTQWSWISSADEPELADPRAYGYRVPFRFDHAPTAAELTEYTVRILASLPPDVYEDSLTYLDLQRIFTVINSLILSFLVAFSVFALIAVAAIVANLVAGIVIASYREVGVVKALGFTPAQVVQVFVGHMAAPAVLACLIGVPLGTLVAQPILGYSAGVLGLATGALVSIPVDLAAAAAVLLAVGVAALIPAWRAGQLSAVRALTVGTSPDTTPSSRLARRLGRVRRLPRPVSLGIGDAFTRPGRSLVTACAIAVGVAALTFSYGLRGSLQTFVAETSPPSAGVLVVRTPDTPDATAMQVMQSQPETQGVVATTSRNMFVPGVDSPVLAFAMRGPSDMLDFHLFVGRWFDGPGEVVSPAGFMRDAHLQLGDSFTGTINGRALTLKVVGENFDLNGFGHTVYMDYANLAQVSPSAPPPDTYYIVTAPGTDNVAFGERVYQADPNGLSVENPAGRTGDRTRIILYVVITLAVVLLVVAVVGVFNATLLSANERTRDVAILKAIGMTVREVVLMVMSSALLLGLIGGVAGVALGVGMHRGVLGIVGGLIGNDIPPVVFSVFRPLSLAYLAPALVVFGLLVALAGAWLPARWAGRKPVVAVLHAE